MYSNASQANNSDHIRTHLCAIISRVTHQDISPLRTEGHLVKDFGMDSLEMLELVMECEKEFNVVIPDREWTAITRMQDLVFAINRQLPVPSIESAA